MKKIVFLTATRAEFGKMKTLMQAVEKHKDFECYVFVTGMHMLKKYGSTYDEIKKARFKNIYMKKNQSETSNDMLKTLSKTINIFDDYVKRVKPDLIVVHGDRLEALAGAIVGAFSNIKVAHIEGGEVSGTIDESIRHAITKFSHIHFVSNEDAAKRIIQLGELKEAIKIIGSPDIDIMLSNHLPKLEDVKKHYEISFEKYAIFMFHPVVSEVEHLEQDINIIISALKDSQKNYVVIYPNNDKGTDIIQKAILTLKDNPKFRIFPSIRLEKFLVLLKNSDFMIGNSSAGIRETCVYGIPSIDLGTRQSGRYDENKLKNIIHCNINKEEILSAICHIDEHRIVSKVFGKGNSTQEFMNALESKELWDMDIQKKFIDLE